MKGPEIKLFCVKCVRCRYIKGFINLSGIFPSSATYDILCHNGNICHMPIMAYVVHNMGVKRTVRSSIFAYYSKTLLFYSKSV